MTNASRDSLGNVLCWHGRPFACIECGEEYARELDAPVIELPEKHPLRIRAEKAEAQRDRLRSALVGLVGGSDRAELEAMEAVLRSYTAPVADIAASIDAIHALLETL